MIFKKLLPLIIVFFTISFLSISVSAETSNNSFGGSDHGGGGSDGDRLESYVPFVDSDTVSFSFTFLGHSYTFYIPFYNNFMPIARDIIFYFLLARSLFTKFKSFPSLISSVPFIGSTDPAKVDYNLSYKK